MGLGVAPLKNNASATSVKHSVANEGTTISGHILKRSGSMVTTKQVLKANSSIEAPLTNPNKIEK